MLIKGTLNENGRSQLRKTMEKTQSKWDEQDRPLQQGWFKHKCYCQDGQRTGC